MPPSESYARTLDRVRRPAVHITYEVELDGATQQKELPFVVGVLADLSGNPEKPLPALKKRNFVSIDRDNFDDVLAGIKPRLSFTVENLLRDDGKAHLVTLDFSRMADFDPPEVVERVEPLRKLLKLREHLSGLLNKMDGNDRLEEELQKIVGDTEALTMLSVQARQSTTQHHEDD
jgi:type VI secretion system protein ImpB